MADLERSLRALAPAIEWPETPAVAAGLELAPRRRLRARSWVLVAVAAAVLAFLVALAVPDARSSILRFLHLGGATIERVSTLPAAEERPLGAGLGRPVTAAEAATVLGAPFRLPAMRPGQRLPVLRAVDGAVSTLLATPAPVLLTETAGTGLLKKLASIATSVQSVEVAPGVEGIWLSGAQHVYVGPSAPPRLAGNVLLWERDGITYRLEGRALAKERALELARQIDGT
jgi:hypothetical protein